LLIKLSKQLALIAIDRSAIADDIKMRDSSLQYIEQEKKRINKILTDNNGTR
jgi:hypothetical protein